MINLEGQVIGVNTWGPIDREGIDFAVSSDELRDRLRLLQHGYQAVCDVVTVKDKQILEVPVRAVELGSLRYSFGVLEESEEDLDITFSLVDSLGQIVVLEERVKGSRLTIPLPRGTHVG